MLLDVERAVGEITVISFDVEAAKVMELFNMEDQSTNVRKLYVGERSMRCILHKKVADNRKGYELFFSYTPLEFYIEFY